MYTNLFPEMPESPKLIKSEDEDIVNDLIKEIVDCVCNTCEIYQNPKIENENLKYTSVEIKKKEHFLYFIINYCYNILTYMFNIQYLKKIEHVKIAYKLNNKKIVMQNMSNLEIYDNVLQINSDIKIAYEFIISISKLDNNIVCLNLIQNNFNIKKIYLKSKYYDVLYNKIVNNMNYHVRYNPILTSVVNKYKTIKA